MTRRPLLLACLLPLALACPTTEPTTEPPLDQGLGMPEGESTWEGTLEVGGFLFLATATLENDGGDLSGSLYFEDDPAAPSGLGSGTFALTGTHDPRAGLVGLAPQDWIVANPLSELLGFFGSYDPETETLSGTVVDAASPQSNSFVGGPATLMLVSGDGAPTAIGDGAMALDSAEATFSGVFQCASRVRPIEGWLAYDGDGAVRGENTWAETELGVDTIGTHGLYGVHNPDTGSLTLFPEIWSDYPATDSNYATNWLDGGYNADTRSMVASVRVTRGGCLEDQFVVEFP